VARVRVCYDFVCQKTYLTRSKSWCRLCLEKEFSQQARFPFANQAQGAGLLYSVIRNSSTGQQSQQTDSNSCRARVLFISRLGEAAPRKLRVVIGQGVIGPAGAFEQKPTVMIWIKAQPCEHRWIYTGIKGLMALHDREVCIRPSRHVVWAKGYQMPLYPPLGRMVRHAGIVLHTHLEGFVSSSDTVLQAALLLP